jgi:hypothetical protein
VSAVTDHEEAQRATLAARDALGALNTLIAAGDRGVSGSDLQAAEAEVTVCERLEAGALARAQEEQADAEAAAQERAIADLTAGYERTSSEFSAAIEKALTSLSNLLTAAENHRTTTRNAFVSTRLNTTGSVPGYGHLLTPAPEEALDAIIELAYKQIGMRSTSSYPHLTIEPIAHFLPAGVSA